MVVSNDIKPASKLGVSDRGQRVGPWEAPFIEATNLMMRYRPAISSIEQDRKANLWIDGEIYYFAKEEIR